MQVGWNAPCLAHRREHVVCQLKFVVFPAVVLHLASKQAYVLRNWIAIGSSQNRYIRKKTCSDFRHPSASDVSMKASGRSRSSAVVLRISLHLRQYVPPFYSPKKEDDYQTARCNFAHRCKRIRVALWVFPSNAESFGKGIGKTWSKETVTTTTAPHAVVSDRLEPRLCSIIYFLSPSFRLTIFLVHALLDQTSHVVPLRGYYVTCYRCRG